MNDNSKIIPVATAVATAAPTDNLSSVPSIIQQQQQRHCSKAARQNMQPQQHYSQQHQCPPPTANQQRERIQVDYTRAKLHAVMKKSPLLSSVNVAEYSETELRCLVNLNINTEVGALPIIFAKFMIRSGLQQMVSIYPTIGKWIRPENISCRLEYDELLNLPVTGERMSIYMVVAKNLITNALCFSMENLSEFLDSVGCGKNLALSEANGKSKVETEPANKTMTTTNNDMSTINATLRRLTEDYSNTLSGKFSLRNSEESYSLNKSRSKIGSQDSSSSSGAKLRKQLLKRHLNEDSDSSCVKYSSGRDSDDEYYRHAKHSSTQPDHNNYYTPTKHLVALRRRKIYRRNYDKDEENDNSHQQHGHKRQNSNHTSRGVDFRDQKLDNDKEEEAIVDNNKNKDDKTVDNEEDTHDEDDSVYEEQNDDDASIRDIILHGDDDEDMELRYSEKLVNASSIEALAAEKQQPHQQQPQIMLSPATATAAVFVAPLSASPSHSKTTSPATDNTTITTTQQQQQQSASNENTQHSSNPSGQMLIHFVTSPPQETSNPSLPSQAINTTSVTTNIVVARSSSVDKRDLLESFVRDSHNNLLKLNKDFNYFRDDDENDESGRDIQIGNGDDNNHSDDDLSITPSNSASQKGYHSSRTGSCTNKYVYEDSASITKTSEAVKRKPNKLQLADIKLKSSCDIRSYEKTLNLIACANGIVEDSLVLSHGEKTKNADNKQNDNDDNESSVELALPKLALGTTLAKPMTMTETVAPPLAPASVRDSIAHYNNGDRGVHYNRRADGKRDTRSMMFIDAEDEDSNDDAEDNDDFYCKSNNKISSNDYKLKGIPNNRNLWVGNDYYNSYDDGDEEEEEEDQLVDRLISVK